MCAIPQLVSGPSITGKSHTNCRTFQEDDICDVVWHVYLSCFFYNFSNFCLVFVGKFFLVVTH